MNASPTLAGILPSDRERDPGQYPIDGVTPAAAFRATDRLEVTRIIEAADQRRLAVVPQGARTALALGCPLDRYDVALDLTGLDRFVAYEPDDLTITVEGGMTLATLQARLGEHGQYLSIDPPPGDEVTIGGLLATARPGAWREHLPAARDLVLGVTVALPDGQLARSGGRVVKNVSGYDLHRLHTGALGTLGVIVEASFKVAPLPATVRHVALRFTHIEQAAALAFAARRAALPLRALTLLSGATAATIGFARAPHLLVELAGSSVTVERGIRELRALAALQRAAHGEEFDGQASAALRGMAAMPADAGDAIARLGVPASEVAATIETVSELGLLAWGHLAAGSVLALGPIDAALAGDLRALAATHGGFAQLEAGPAPLRREVDPFGHGDMALLRALRDQFDPRRTLNPGRWGEGL